MKVDLRGGFSIAFILLNLMRHDYCGHNFHTFAGSFIRIVSQGNVSSTLATQLNRRSRKHYVMSKEQKKQSHATHPQLFAPHGSPCG